MNVKATAVRFEDIAGQYKLRIAAAILLAVSVLGLALNTAHGDSIPGWGNNFRGAFAQAKASGNPLILVIAADGCPACAEFAGEATKQSAVRALSGMIKVRAEAGEHPDLVRAYASEGTPTILVFTAESGYESPVYSHTGVLKARELVRLANAIKPQEVAEPKSETRSQKSVASREKEPTRTTESAEVVAEPVKQHHRGRNPLAGTETASASRAKR
jgi:hypothetical protein